MGNIAVKVLDVRSSYIVTSFRKEKRMLSPDISSVRLTEKIELGNLHILIRFKSTKTMFR